jgi:teichuronic acid biosynthesis glycosyltransferase TuaC
VCAQLSQVAPAEVAPRIAQAAQRRLNIVSICRTLPTPDDPVAGTFVANRLAALSRRADVRIVQPVPFFPIVKPSPRWATAGAHAFQGVRIEPEPMFYLPGVMKSLDSLWLARSAGRKVAHIKHRGTVDLIDAHFGYPDGVGSVRLGATLGLPVFVTIRGSETDFLRTPGIGPQLVKSLNAATGCISVSHSLRRLAMDHGIDGDRMCVIPNAVDRAVFRPESREAARQQLGLDPNAPLIVSVGHLIAGKRHHVLVRALAGVRKTYPTATLALIGGPAYDRAYPAELERITREVGLSEHVRMLGRLPQPLVNTWLQAADVFALATEREGCCNAVLEALAAGRPVISTPVGDNSHFVQDGNGALVPVDDVPAFEQALTSALGRGWDAELISRGLDVGDWDDVARKVVEFFAERLSAGVAGAGAAHG